MRGIPKTKSYFSVSLALICFWCHTICLPLYGVIFCMGLFWSKTRKKLNMLDTYSSYIFMFHWAQLILGFIFICTVFGIISLFNLLCNSWEKILDKTSFWSFDPIPEPISNTWWLIVPMWSYSSYFCQLIIVYLLFI